MKNYIKQLDKEAWIAIVLGIFAGAFIAFLLNNLQKPKQKLILPMCFTKICTPQLIKPVQAEEPQPADEQIANYIGSKAWEYSIAIRLAKSENFYNERGHFKCDKLGGLNPNGTRDHGLWQINDIHIQSGAISLADANDCFKATDFAFGLYKAHHGFTPWSAYKNGSYLGHDEKI